MNAPANNSFLLSALMTGLALFVTHGSSAQTFTLLHGFTNSDGANPMSTVIVSGNTLYGTTQNGGSSCNGTLFAVNTGGSGFTNLHDFTATSGINSTNGDGKNPIGGLILSGNTLYGTTSLGGVTGSGVVFSVNMDGSDFTNLHSFTNASDGANPHAGLVLSSNTLYGVATRGGSGAGTVFALNTDGSDFTNLHNFIGSDGNGPFGGLVLGGNTLYGTTIRFGASLNFNGTVFAINTDGSGFTTLHDFTPTTNATNSDGGGPVATLALSGDTLYGAASLGGSWGVGTLFAINIGGTGFTNLHNFSELSEINFGTNNDGIHPNGLFISGHTLYGTAQQGGGSGNGAAFAMNTDGTGFTNLYNFTNLTNNTNGNGTFPNAGRERINR